MTRYKIHIDPNVPGDEQIDKRKDFKKLLYNYQKATKPLYRSPLNLYKNRKIFLAVLIIIALVWILTEMLMN